MALHVAGDSEEAIRAYLQAYSSTKLSKAKWEFASHAYSIAKEIDDKKVADEIKSRVSVDADLDRITESDWLAEPIDINRVRSTLLASCYDPMIYMFGGEYCMHGLEAIYSKLSVESSVEISQSDEIIKLYADAIIYAERSELFRGKFPDWRNQFVHEIESLLENSSFHSPALFATYASISEDPAKQMWALESAAFLAPQNGAAQYRLGLAYLEHDKYREAISQFKLARTLLPEWRYELLDQKLLAAEQGAKAHNSNEH
jgi:tetratricopeptide (TPR) repeat protein